MLVVWPCDRLQHGEVVLCLVTVGRTTWRDNLHVYWHGDLSRWRCSGGPGSRRSTWSFKVFKFRAWVNESSRTSVRSLSRVPCGPGPAAHDAGESRRDRVTGPGTVPRQPISVRASRTSRLSGLGPAQHTTKSQVTDSDAATSSWTKLTERRTPQLTRTRII